MSGAIYCHGCGQTVEIPQDFARRKIQCPSCGVYCEIPAAALAKQNVPRSAQSTPKAASPPPQELKAVKVAPVAALHAAKTPESRMHKQPVRTCAHCGETVKVKPDAQGQWGTCPSCGEPMKAAKPKVPPGERTAARPPPDRVKKPLETFTALKDTSDDPEDGKPYQVFDTGERVCPDCRGAITKDMKLCPHCGFDFETGDKPVKTHELVQRTWVAGWPLRRRFILFLAATGTLTFSSILGISMGGSIPTFLTSWLLFTFILAFVFGTFDRLDLTRNAKGKVRLTRTWRICFLPRPPGTVPLNLYEGLVTGTSYQKDVTDWAVLIAFLLAGLIPGIIWYIIAFQKDAYFVALCQNHGFPEYYLYHGWDKEQMDDIASTLTEVAGLPHNVG